MALGNYNNIFLNEDIKNWRNLGERHVQPLHFAGQELKAFNLIVWRQSWGHWTPSSSSCLSKMPRRVSFPFEEFCCFSKRWNFSLRRYINKLEDFFFCRKYTHSFQSCFHLIFLKSQLLKLLFIITEIHAHAFIYF